MAASAISAPPGSAGLSARFEAWRGASNPARGTYRDFAATEIQRLWRGWFVRRLYVRFRSAPARQDAAARTLQRRWRRRARGRRDARNGYAPLREAAASRIQSWWRRVVDRKIFSYFRALVVSCQQGVPARRLLQAVNPLEARLMGDAASRLYVRFRLAGPEFPPTVVYKIFTGAPITDIGAFAPRDYRRASGRWYERVENNGWRPIASARLEEVLAEPEGGKRRAPAVFYPLRAVRRAHYEQERKQRKRQWMQQLYRMGREGAWELEADELLQWSKALDFDRYYLSWSQLATTQ